MTITDESFLAFLNCETKSFLKSSGVVGDQREPHDWRQRLDEEFERKCCIELRAHFREDECLAGVSLSKVLENNQCRLAMDCVAETLEIQSRLHALERLTPTGNIKPDVYIPIRFVHGEKITTQNKMLLSFDALALYTSLGTMPPFGRIIHGSKLATVKVKVAGLVQTVQGIITRITAQHASQKPPHLVLCKHCPECEFRTRCHQIATENDDLSLLSGMTEKERRKQHSRGIFTVTQLSYTFRARRKPKRLVSKPDKYSHALKALAIRERKIYVAGTPDSKIHRQPVYLDVEGIPDRNFYYLIGLRVKNGDEFVQHSFWANEPSEEKETWVSFLRTLAKIDNPQLLYYGSYETQFLKRMKELYPDVIEDPALLDRLIRESVNILSAIYAQIYFPTYSNGLKEIAQYLGFRWSDSNATGLHALTLRHEWEFSKDSSLKQQLLTYNAEDCEALQRVATTVIQLCQRQIDVAMTNDGTVVHTDLLKPESPYRFARNEFSVPEFQFINQCAYWDYQREKIYVRSSHQLKQATEKPGNKSGKVLPVDEIVTYPPVTRCPKCSGTKIGRYEKTSHIVYDLKFNQAGVRRWVLKHCYYRYYCYHCDTTFYSHPQHWTRGKFGQNLIAYVIYQNIGLRLPQESVANSLNELFGFDLQPSLVHDRKARAAQYYQLTYERILDKIVHGKLVHADETKVSIKGQPGYVWVVTNLEAVAYFYTETRDGDKIQALLKDFKGVLVSDFYGVYDSINCPQQKCLIHLMRDLNDDLRKEPFNEELKQLVREFALLLKPMVETVDRCGLKAGYLREHKIFVERFYTGLSQGEYKTEIAIKYKKRFEKNHDKLFTFLDYDDVPWNNNNAEHAIKAFATLRKVIGGTSTDKGIREYLTLLSISETCKYKGVSFLEFLRSGEKDIDVFIEGLGPGESSHDSPSQGYDV